MERSKQEKTQNDAQCRQSQELRSIGLIINSIVHSFNNAIGVIRGYADLSLRATDPDSCIFSYQKNIIDGTEFMKELSEKMRIFGKQAKQDLKLVQIHSVVEEVVNSFEVSLTLPIKIQQDIDTTCGPVLADADQIQQAVINLCNNAFDAMSENGGILKIVLKEVDVEVSFAEEFERLNEGRYVKLTVCDTGCGMDPDTLKLIYEPFFTTKKAGEGVGLGLTVVHEIVSSHIGKIIVESKSGEGTTFDIYLPLVNQDHKKLEE